MFWPKVLQRIDSCIVIPPIAFGTMDSDDRVWRPSFREPWPRLRCPGRPDLLPREGDYYQSRRGNTGVRCRGWSAPFDDRTHEGGALLGSMCPGTFFGPVETWVESDKRVTVLVRGWWICVWRAGDYGGPLHTHPEYYPNGRRYRHDTNFAFRVPRGEVYRWKQRGWRDE